MTIKLKNLADSDHLIPEQVLRKAFDNHSRLTLSFSGAEDVVLIDMATKISDSVEVFCLDTGRLHAETYHFIENVRQHYNLNIQILFPDAEAVERLAREKGLFSFYQDGHQECCAVRKILPLKRHLADYDAWITGQRRDQSPTRAHVPQIHKDPAFSTDQHQVTKYNPLANWSSDDVWHYIRTHQVPYNPLHDQGYRSIGCAPCTKATGPGQHEREGRWWWEQSTQKECGLHVVPAR